MMHFQTSPLLKPFSKVSVFIGVYGRFTADDGRKRIKKHGFSNENALVRMEPLAHFCKLQFEPKSAVTLDNFSCNLSHISHCVVVTQVARIVA